MDGRRGAGGAAGVRTIEGDISLNDDGGQRAGHYADGAFPWLRVVPQISLKQHDLIVVHFQRKLGVRCNGPCGRGPFAADRDEHRMQRDVAANGQQVDGLRTLVIDIGAALRGHCVRRYRQQYTDRRQHCHKPVFLHIAAPFHGDVFLTKIDIFSHIMNRLNIYIA